MTVFFFFFFNCVTIKDGTNAQIQTTSPFATDNVIVSFDVMVEEREVCMRVQKRAFLCNVA